MASIDSLYLGARLFVLIRVIYHRCSLALVSKSMKVSCLPQFIQDDDNDDDDIENKEVFNLQGAIHPCLME